MDVGLDLRTRTTLLCGALALAIALSTLLRGRARPLHLAFAGMAANIGLFYLAQSLAKLLGAAWLERGIAVLAVLLPTSAVLLFEAILPREPTDRARLLQASPLLGLPLVVLVLGPAHRDPLVRSAVFLYVFGLIAAGLERLWRRGKRSPSRITRGRVKLVLVIGSLATLFSVADFVWFLGATPPPVGAVLSIAFLFMLAESLRHERLLDMYEVVGKLVVATGVAFAIAGIFYVMVAVLGGFETMYLNAVVAATIILVVFEPLREKVDAKIHQLFIRERFDLERSIAEARRRLVHTLELREMASIAMTALEQSRRVTDAGLYLRDADGTGFDRIACIGSLVPSRVEVATSRALLDRLERGPVVLEDLERDRLESGRSGTRDKPRDLELAAAAVLGPLRGGVVLGLRTADGKELSGLLLLADERVKDAFSPDEVALLRSLASHIEVVVENSHVYDQMKERYRLQLLGRMAAGLAHEIRNPLGAIKGAAQLLAESGPEGGAVEAGQREFLGIILEEANRLERLVVSVLDLARPRAENVVPVDVNAVVRRTVQVLSAERPDEVTIEIHLGEDLPRVAIDPEQLRQVLMNLVHNAIQAMKGRGTITLSTRARSGGWAARTGAPLDDAPATAFVELQVTDTGPGISQKVLQNLFLPFFTTKQRGTGLGLAISRSIVQGAGGRIDVRSQVGEGSKFVVLLPAATDELSAPGDATAPPDPIAPPAVAP